MVYADPLICPACGGKMRIIAFIQNKETIEHILEHLGLLPEHAHRPPPAEPAEPPLTYEPIFDDLSVPEQMELLQTMN